MSELTNTIMGVLEPIGVVVGIILAVPVFWTWFDVVIGGRRRRRRWFREVRAQPGQRPAILIVDLLTGRDIRMGVERFRTAHEALRAIPEERIIVVERSRRLTPEDIRQLAQEVREAAGRLIATGADTVHYFHAGPAAVAAIVGAELANGHRVMVYQHDPDGYHNFGPLRPDP
ncbi:SAVED domain-containing protein [uncultured Thiodictyon sp.]|uniref:SAVED domain-containing protein n=1 Tax=uncultured Thiodictyon sp. TaxID=1846217 RepID=UPI0025FC892A|nr:SAVED domain-containing protein [uncultured Thiodictyon sp.]